MNKYVLNNMNIEVGSKVVIDITYNPEKYFEYDSGLKLPSNYKDVISTVKKIYNDDFGKGFELNIDNDFMTTFYIFSLSLHDAPRPISSPKIGQKCIIGKDISDCPLYTNIDDMQYFDTDGIDGRFNQIDYKSLYDKIFTVTDHIILGNKIYYEIKSGHLVFIMPSWFLYQATPSYDPKKFIRTFENFKNNYE